jgi:hypothetical protein
MNLWELSKSISIITKISGKYQENKEYLLCGAGKNPQI